VEHLPLLVILHSKEETAFVIPLELMESPEEVVLVGPHAHGPLCDLRERIHICELSMIRKDLHLTEADVSLLRTNIWLGIAEMSNVIDEEIHQVVNPRNILGGIPPPRTFEA
jgi:hypothetical protein